MSNIDESLQQLYQKEKELITQRTSLQNFVNTEIMYMQYESKFKITLEELDRLEEKTNCYQPLGKAFILKNKDDFKNDLKFLIDKTNKEMEEVKNNKKYMSKKVKESETNLLEMSKNLNLLKA